MLLKKISALELSRKFTKIASLVGSQLFELSPIVSSQVLHLQLRLDSLFENAQRHVDQRRETGENPAHKHGGRMLFHQEADHQGIALNADHVAHVDEAGDPGGDRQDVLEDQQGDGVQRPGADAQERHAGLQLRVGELGAAPQDEDGGPGVEGEEGVDHAPGSHVGGHDDGCGLRDEVEDPENQVEPGALLPGQAELRVGRVQRQLLPEHVGRGEEKAERVEHRHHEPVRSRQGLILLRLDQTLLLVRSLTQGRKMVNVCGTV